MIKNYFKIAWRNITRHKGYTAINILGLALGICACIVIFLVANYEFSFDRFHPDGERIYRIVGEVQRNGGEKEFLNSPVSEVAGFENQIPGFETQVSVHSYGAEVSIKDGKNEVKRFDSKIDGTYTNSTIVTGPQYFNLFRYQWLEGTAAVMTEPFKVVLTEKRAHIYFGNIPLADIMGKTVIYDDSLQVTVGGIIKDWANNTDFGYTDFISISTATHSFLKTDISSEDWSSLSPHRSMAFVKLAKDVTPSQVNNRFTAFIREHVKLPPGVNVLTMQLQPLKDIHFTTDFHRGDDGDNFRKPYLPTLYALMGVAIFILIIAVVNFINLATAQSMQRAKEIGVRKVMGGKKSSIMLQLLSETFFVTLFAVIVSVLLVNPMLALFKEYLPEKVAFHFFTLPTILFVVTLTVVTSLLAGFYPAKMMAAYVPVVILKNNLLQKTGDKISLRKALIVFQFTISLVFIIGAIVIGKQINFMNNADKGFNTDAIITISNWNDHEGRLQVLANKVQQLPEVQKVLLEGNAPMGFAQMIDNFKYKAKEEINMLVSAQIGNEDFVPFYKMKLVAGRNVLHSDSLSELVINETLAKTIGFANPQQTIGQLLYKGDIGYPIVGVVADFHTGSFHETIKPTVIENVPDRKQSIAIKLAMSEKDPGAVKNVLAQIETEWKKIFPSTLFKYSFLNESITLLYEQEKKTAWLVNMAMFITIFISSMGLFGLGMFTAQRRTKEIGIRKILGASVAGIAAMLSKDFVSLVMMALIIASPIAYYFMHQWLNDFVYRTTMGWTVFALAGCIAVLIALLTVCYQAVKAAVANPVKSLKVE